MQSIDINVMMVERKIHMEFQADQLKQKETGWKVPKLSFYTLDDSLTIAWAKFSKIKVI